MTETNRPPKACYRIFEDDYSITGKYALQRHVGGETWVTIKNSNSWDTVNVALDTEIEKAAYRPAIYYFDELGRRIPE